MPAIRSLAAIGKKWNDRASSAGPQYAEGIATPKKDWANEAARAQPNWEAGVQQAAQAKSFSKGVTAAGTPKWQQKATVKGVQRFGPGVQVAQPDYQAGFEKYRQVIEATALPPRLAKGDPRNLQRVGAMSQALRKAKVGG